MIRKVLGGWVPSLPLFSKHPALVSPVILNVTALSIAFVASSSVLGGLDLFQGMPPEMRAWLLALYYVNLRDFPPQAVT